MTGVITTASTPFVCTTMHLGGHAYTSYRKVTGVSAERMICPEISREMFWVSKVLAHSDYETLMHVCVQHGSMTAKKERNNGPVARNCTNQQDPGPWRANLQV